MKSKVTEADVFRYYWPLVVQECVDSYKGLEWEDRMEEAGEALIYVIRTYRSSFGNFIEYMLGQLRRIMKQKNKEAWLVKKLESNISLDAPLFSDTENYTLATRIESQIDETEFDVTCFLEALSLKEKKVINLMLNDFTADSISRELSLSFSEVQLITESLRNKALAYYGDGSHVG